MRLPAKQRKAQILTAAIELAAKIGYQNIELILVAKELNIAHSLVSNYFGSISNFKRTVVKHVIDKGELLLNVNKLTLHDLAILKVIAQALSNNDPLVLKISQKLKQKAVRHIVYP